MDSKDIYAYEFGPFHLNVAERYLLRNGRSIHLTPKIFDILLVLVRERGHLVGKDELINEIWPNITVEDNNLTVSISMLRKAIGESHGEHEYIKTIPKRGYRFVAGVKEIRNGIELEEEKYRGTRKEGRLGYREKSISSVAILPLVNSSNDPNLEYLCDGITESLINSLSQVHSLKVMARSTVFRFKDGKIDPLAAGQKMGVSAVLVGRLNLSNKIIEISLELVDVSDGSQIWSDLFKSNFSDILTAHKEIAEEISKRLRIKLSAADRKRLAKRYTENTEAYHLYLKGRYFWTKYTHEGITKAMKYFEQAIELDPRYALAYAGLADAYYRISSVYISPKEALPKASSAAHKGVEIDDELAEAHMSLGLIKIFYDHDWCGAEREFKRAIELNPSSSLAYKRYGEYLMFMGRCNEASVEFKTALDLDPLSIQNNIAVALNLCIMQQYEKAIEQLKWTLELDPNYWPAHNTLGYTYIQKGEFDKAIAEYQLVCQFDKDSNVPAGFLGYAYAVSGETREAEIILRRLKRAPENEYVSSYSVAIIYLGLGKKDKAIEWLEKAYEEHSDWLVWLRVGPELNSIRSDPRFKAIMRLVGFEI